MVKTASAFMLCIYIAENATVILLRENRVQWYAPPYKSFLPQLVFGITVCLGIRYSWVKSLVSRLEQLFYLAVLCLLYDVPVPIGRVVGSRGRRQDLIEERSPIVAERMSYSFLIRLLLWLVSSVKNGRQRSYSN